jgi:hypothetical protein
MPALPRFAVVCIALAAGCPAEPAPSTLPPAGLAGVPSSTGAGGIAIAPGAPMPAGHPPIDNPHGGAAVGGGDDGAPLPPQPGQAPLPNLPGMPSSTGGAGGGIGAGVVFAGTVVEKLDVPQYTYLRVKTAGGEEWVAVSTMQIDVGARVTINQQIVMENFPSKSLGRTFTKLVMGTATLGG